MELLSKARTIHIADSTLELARNQHGIVEIRGEDPFALQRGIGFAHAHDRMMQLFITRILAQGRVCEFLFDTVESFALDVLIRKLGFYQDIQEDRTNLAPETLRWIEAYCEGINAYLEHYGTPLICKLLKIKSHHWTVLDVMAVTKFHLYFGLTQIQERVERFIIQAIHDDVSVEKLKQIFTPHLDTLDSKLISTIKKAHLERPYLDEQMEFMPGMSNNWAIAASKSASGSALLCNDPHLQINRLPPLWYEIVGHIGEEKRFGVTSPGFPGIIIGRSTHLSVGVTYGMMDMIDFFIEEVSDEQCRREEGTDHVTIREEVIQRKKDGEARLYFFESHAGVIERQQMHHQRLEEGLYFALNWSAKKNGVSPTLNAVAQLWTCQTVKEAQKVVAEMTFSFNWVLADSGGNIGYQQSGRLPVRKYSGLYPLPAYEKEALWNGFVPAQELVSEYNPERGFVASANDDKNQPGKPLSISVPYASYRFDRIDSVLSEKRKFTVADMKALQTDLYSQQAALFMEQIKHLIPDTPEGKILKAWDLRYEVSSKGATLFEAFYQDLLLDVFGKIFGRAVWESIVKCHSLLVFTHGHFDRILLTGDESWFGEKGKEARLASVLEKSLSKFSQKVPTWGEWNQFYMDHMLFEGKLPKSFGKGPYSVPGGRATIPALILFQEHERKIAAGASYRFITDMGKCEADTALCGGVTEGRFSKYYGSDLDLWLNFTYKTVNFGA